MNRYLEKLNQEDEEFKDQLRKVIHEIKNHDFEGHNYKECCYDLLRWIERIAFGEKYE